MISTTKATKPSAAATAQASIPTLQATAAVLLPGMKHARSLLEVSIRVLAMHLAKELEFRAVAVMACDDEIIPSQHRIDEVGTKRIFGRFTKRSGTCCT